MKRLRKLWFKIFPHYTWSYVCPHTYSHAEKLIHATAELPEEEQYRICPQFEDRNRVVGVVWLGKRKRVTE